MIQPRTTDHAVPPVLVAIPVHNEEDHVARVLDEVRRVVSSDDAHILVIDDGSTDRTPDLLAEAERRHDGVSVIRHDTNLGYGRAMRRSFEAALRGGYDLLITMDCDEQHEPARIPAFVDAARQTGADVVSGSRYFLPDADASTAPPERRAINRAITDEINRRLGLSLTDGFCGFKAYRTEALADLEFDEDGYAFPMQFWVQAVANGLTITEIPVELIYLDFERSFGGALDDHDTRLAHYRRVLHCELERCADRLPRTALRDVDAGCRSAG